MQIGATIDGIRAARQVPRKTKFTRATRASEIAMVIQTSWIACLVNTVKSTAISSLVPLGRDLLISGSWSEMPLEISRSLAWDWRVMAMPTMSRPLERKVRRRSSGPSSMRAMSPRRVT